MELRSSGHDNADVNNLLAQAYVGDAQDERAFEALKRAMSFTATNEKLYMFVADACMGRQSYALGMQVVDLGLKNLPNSGRLHFERGMFLALMDRFDDAKSDFELARRLAPDSDIAYIASAQEAMYAGNIEEALRVSREGMARGIRHFLLLTLFGEASLRSGITPGQKEFQEAREALEAAVANRPNYPSSQLSLGKLYLQNGQTREAITRLEKALALNPTDPAVYAALASAYRKAGDSEKARASLSKLAELNQAQAERIRTGTGETKTSYGGTASPHP
jgi:tetratricopeptide (TPR) repeat protein